MPYFDSKCVTAWVYYVKLKELVVLYCFVPELKRNQQSGLDLKDKNYQHAEYYDGSIVTWNYRRIFDTHFQVASKWKS